MVEIGQAKSWVGAEWWDQLGYCCGTHVNCQLPNLGVVILNYVAVFILLCRPKFTDIIRVLEDCCLPSAAAEAHPPASSSQQQPGAVQPAAPQATPPHKQQQQQLVRIKLHTLQQQQQQEPSEVTNGQAAGGGGDVRSPPGKSSALDWSEVSYGKGAAADSSVQL
jgi:hypothetical protein